MLEHMCRGIFEDEAHYSRRIYERRQEQQDWARANTSIRLHDEVKSYQRPRFLYEVLSSALFGQNSAPLTVNQLLRRFLPLLRSAPITKELGRYLNLLALESRETQDIVLAHLEHNTKEGQAQ